MSTKAKYICSVCPTAFALASSTNGCPLLGQSSEQGLLLRSEYTLLANIIGWCSWSVQVMIPSNFAMTSFANDCPLQRPSNEEGLFL